MKGGKCKTKCRNRKSLRAAETNQIVASLMRQLFLAEQKHIRVDNGL